VIQAYAVPRCSAKGRFNLVVLKRELQHRDLAEVEDLAHAHGRLDAVKLLLHDLLQPQTLH
jgi:hypothetical protein